MVVQQANQELVLFALGPVQSFIATARRTQDLWVGSQLLSDLARIGLDRAEKQGATSIYPVRTSNGEWPKSVPNRFAVIVSAGQGQAIGRSITDAVEEAWKNMANRVQTYFSNLQPRSGWQTAWERQVHAWLETYWVAWLWDKQNYGDAFRRAGLALDARKRVRPYPTKPEFGEKCTLCGIREVLHDEKTSREDVRRFWKQIREHSRVKSSELREGERLCAICIIKRFAQEARILRTDRFPSTSSIASASFRGAILDKWDALEKHVKTHLGALQQLGAPQFNQPEPFPYLRDKVSGKPGAESFLHYDGDFLYRETFSKERLEETLGREPNEKLRLKALDTLNELLNAANAQNINAPPVYLAALVLDGDRMGALLSECEDSGAHRTISRALCAFAQDEVPQIIEQKYPGQAVYAGGDDVLALLPIDCALSAANEVRERLTKVFKEKDYPNRTASAGVAIAHHTQPLEGILRAARLAEQAAKDNYDRNAIAIDVLRRSGERRQVGLKWFYHDIPEEAAIELIQRIRELIAIGKLSGKVAYDGLEEAVALIKIPTAQKLELGRLLKRHWQEKLTDEAEEVIEELATSLAVLSQPHRTGIEGVGNWLLLARFLAQGGRE